MRRIKIGNIDLRSKIFLAPMAGVTDTVFRMICKEFGAGLLVTEMVSAKGLYYNDRKTRQLSSINERERPVALQIFGSDAGIIASVIDRKLNTREDIDIIDINMGCPAPKIVKNGDGSALMKNPGRIREILRKAVKVSAKPITIKIRLGWDKNSLNCLEIARLAEEEGVSAITVHGRTRDMFYSGKANWDYIAKIKESISIPVIGNGDVFKPEDGLKLLEYTKCDALAIGRGAMGNPWIFKSLNNLLQGKADYFPTEKEIISLAIMHLDMACGIKGEKIGVREMKKHLIWYIKGLRNSNEIKRKVSLANKRIEIENVLRDYLKELST